MKVAIIGGGMTGLSAAVRLQKEGHEVTIWEQAPGLGGLAQGFKIRDWDWSLEYHYHHIFQTDAHILHLADLVGAPYRFYDTQTAIWHMSGIDAFDGPVSLLQFPNLTIEAKMRMAASLAYLKFVSDWHQFEHVSAYEWITRWMGKEAWASIWEPLFMGKFGKHAKTIGMVWFWGRIHARSQKLGYFDGGFAQLVEYIQKYLESHQVQIHLNEKVQVVKEKVGFKVTSTRGYEMYNKVILALSHRQVPHVVKNLPNEFIEKLQQTQGLGAMTLVLALKHSFLPKDLYWLNVNQEAPFLAVVEHTHMIDRKHYGNDHLLYIGKYLEEKDPLYRKNDQELLDEYLFALQRIRPDFKKSWITASWVFKAPWAQPLVFPFHEEKNLHGMLTPIEGLYWCSMEHVYPWDRGTNYAVEWGAKVADLITRK